MRRSRPALFACLALLAACGASSSPAGTPGQSNPAGAKSITIAPGAGPSAVALPSAGIYGGQILLPSGTGTAQLTFSLQPPSGVPALTELTPQPPIAYITIEAQTPFTLTALPGLNLTAQNLAVIDFFLNEYGNGSWQNTQYSFDNASASTVCFAIQGAAVSLQPGQSLYLGISGDSVLPTSPPQSHAPACPQAL